MLIITSERLLAIITHHLLAVGEKVRKDLLNARIGKISKFDLMPPGVVLKSMPEKSQARNQLGFTSSQLQCAFIGRVVKIKRPDRFLAVVSEIKKRGLDLEFFIAGEGELLTVCRKRIANDNLPVNILGWQSDIERVLSAADIVILTSDNEGTPLSLIQAGMAGLPVVATDVGSVPDVVLNGVTGIVTSTDTTEIADALETLYYDKALRDNLGNAAKQFTLSNFSAQRLVLNHQQLYKRLLANQANF
jgi:glycosyltransferase involved in cell wall biosynthesis